MDNSLKSFFFKQSMDRSPTSITTLFVHPPCPGVVLPLHLMNQGIVKLNFAYGFNNFSVSWDEDMVKAVLSFNGVPFNVELPWESIGCIENDDFALVSRKPITSQPIQKKRFTVVNPNKPSVETEARAETVFPSLSPKEVVQANEEAIEMHREQAPARASNRPGLRLVKKDEDVP